MLFAVLRTFGDYAEIILRGIFFFIKRDIFGLNWSKPARLSSIVLTNLAYYAFSSAQNFWRL